MTEHPTDPTSEPTPIIQRFELGPYLTNCYLATVPGHAGCWIIDASFEPGPIIDAVRDQGLHPELLVLTHAHIDHIAGVDEVRSAFADLPVVIHEAERDWLDDPGLNLSALAGMPVTASGLSRTLAHGDELTLGPTTWQVRHTPGHSPGGITLWHEASGQALVGDALFAGSIGRTDFPGSDFDTLARAIRTQLYTLPEQTRVYPGHGDPTTIGREALTNPFVRDDDTPAA